MKLNNWYAVTKFYDNGATEGEVVKWADALTRYGVTGREVDLCSYETATCDVYVEGFETRQEADDIVAALAEA